MKYILIGSALIGLISSLLLLRIFIPVLKSVKLGQKILDIGPRWHKSKEGTPIMGGLFFGIAALLGCIFAFVMTYINGNLKELGALIASVGFIILNFLSGFIDDYIKLFKKRNKGLSASGKLFIQVAAATGYIAALHFCGYGTQLNLPFIGSVDFGIFYYPVVLLGIVYFVNCVNLTDGIDGLAGSVTLIVTVFFSAVAIFKLQSVEVLILTLPMLGALIGFLFYNLHPAKIFMGDTGSLMLGGFLVAVSFLLKMPIFLLICGFVYIFEGLSVVLQVISFKLTGKRIFKMSPLHHHFEMCGWSEGKIVGTFSFATFVLCAVAYLGIV